MKKVCFGPSQTKRRTVTIDDLRFKVIEFLYANGIPESTAKDFVKISVNRGIRVTPFCSNSEYTRALALLQLIFSTGNTCYISYPQEDCGFEIRIMAMYTVSEAIDYINEHMEVSVEH